MPLADAKVGIMTHSFLYGTAVFEGIRAYWNEDQGQLYLLKLREHFERILDSSQDPADGPGLHASTSWSTSPSSSCAATATARTPTSGRRVYKSTEAIGVKLHDVECRLNILAIPFGDYIATDRGISVRHRLLAAHRRPVHPVARQDRRLVRQPGVLQDGGACSTATTRPSC